MASRSTALTSRSARWRHVRTAVLCASLAGTVAGALAQAGPIEFTGSVGLSHRRLQERSTGFTLLTEQGTAALLQLEGTRADPGGSATSLRLTALGGELRYDGRTQLGLPLSTRARHFEAGLDLLVRPMAPARWGEGWLTLGWLGNQRAIQDSGAVSGLLETSSSLWAGLEWRGPRIPLAGWNLQPAAGARISVWHQVDVDFRGARDIFSLRPLDKTTFDGARRRQLALRLGGSRPDSAWSWAVEWSRISQGDSPTVPLTAAGGVIGTVLQPAMRIEDFGVRLSRRF